MTTRSLKKEKLDDLSLDGEMLHKTLQSLAWINRYFGNRRSIIRAIHAIYKKEKKALAIVDLGCGGGDMALAVAGSLQKHNIQYTITGIDGNAATLAFAQKKCAGYSEINFLQADILSPGFAIPPCDILLSSHFMYHFTEDGLTDFLRNNSSSVSTAFVFSELKRNRLATFLFRCSSFLLPISKLAKEDGLVAIKRSFSKSEWHSVLQRANIGTFRLRDMPLFRVLLIVFSDKKI